MNGSVPLVRNAHSRLLVWAVGLSALVIPSLYLLSDILEVALGGFSPLQLYLTYLGEAPTVFFVLGLYAIQRPRMGWLGLVGAVAYGYALIFFSGFTILGIVTDAHDLPTLAAKVGPFYILHAVVQVSGGILFGLAALRAAVLPRWTAGLLLLGMALHIALSASGMPESYRWVASMAQNLAFASMGALVLRGLPAGVWDPQHSSVSRARMAS
jgi:hypothetical protein